MMQPNYLAFAEANARREFGAKRKTTGPTHWSYYDEPEKAVCGERIEPEQFSRQPTCEKCLEALRIMALDDIR